MEGGLSDDHPTLKICAGVNGGGVYTSTSACGYEGVRPVLEKLVAQAKATAGCISRNVIYQHVTITEPQLCKLEHSFPISPILYICNPFLIKCGAAPI